MTDLQLAQACDISYSPTAIQRFRDELGFDAVPIEDGGFILNSDTAVFRGSQLPITQAGFRDWLTDLNDTVTADGYHRGFWNRACMYHIPDSVTMFTGHSLGGAIAFILGQNGRVVTFGCPRVARHELNGVNYVFGLDPIPKLPFGIGLRFAGEERHIGGISIERLISPATIIIDHLIANYVRSLS